MRVLLAVVLPFSERAVARADNPVGAGKVFVGPEGLTVTIVPLRPPVDGKVLVQFAGSGTVFDGKVIPHTVDAVDAGKTNYETTYHGREWVTIAVRDGVYSLAAARAARRPQGPVRRQADRGAQGRRPLRGVQEAGRRRHPQGAARLRPQGGGGPAGKGAAGARRRVRQGLRREARREDRLEFDRRRRPPGDLARQLLRRAARGHAPDVRRGERGQAGDRRQREDLRLHDGQEHAARPRGLDPHLDDEPQRHQHGGLRPAEPRRRSSRRPPRRSSARGLGGGGRGAPLGEGRDPGRADDPGEDGGLHRREIALRRRRPERQAVDPALLRRRQDVPPRAAAPLGPLRRQLLRAALLRQDQEPELPRPRHADVRVGQLRRRQEDLRRELRRAPDRSHPDRRRTPRRPCSPRPATSRRCTSAPRTTSPATTRGSTSTSTRGTRPRPRRTSASTSAPRGR